MDDWDLFEAIDIEDISALIALGAVDKAQQPKEQSGSSEPILSGADYLRDLLNCGNQKRIYSVLRMQKETFEKLYLYVYVIVCLHIVRNQGLERVERLDCTFNGWGGIRRRNWG
jgi:hypothetical protein